MTYTFLKAQGHATGKSRVEADKLDEARRLLELAGPKLVLPARPPGGRRARGRPPRRRSSTGSDLPDGWFGIDIGPATVAAYGEIIRDAGTVIWNGPMGKFEDEPFRKGTQARRRGHGRLVGRDRRRRRRDGRGRRAVRLRRQDDPRLDRRRGLPRVARRKSVQLAQGDPRSVRMRDEADGGPRGGGVRSLRPSKANDGMNEERTSSAHRAARLGVLDSADRPLVTPSLLNCDFARMAEELEALREAGRGRRPPRRDGRPLRAEPQLRRPGDRRLAAADRFPVRRPPDDLRPGPLPRRLRPGRRATWSSSTSRRCPSRSRCCAASGPRAARRRWR